MTSPDRRVVIAIDGPAASGKSSVAREVARRLGFIYVNSGAMYRAATWHVLERGVDPKESAAVAHLIETARIECDLEEKESRIRIDGVDPAPHLRATGVNDHVSSVSSIPRVRAVLVEKMRAYARAYDAVMEGRDIGSVVFPRTPFKFYVDASPAIRLQRRAAQGQSDPIAARDLADSSRRASPLTLAPDAQVIDTSDLSIAGVVDEIMAGLKEKGLLAAGSICP